VVHINLLHDVWRAVHAHNGME